MKLRSYNDIRFMSEGANNESKYGVPILEDITENWDGLIYGLKRLEMRISSLIGSSFEQDLFVGEKCIFYGTDDYESGSLYGVRRMERVPGSWLVKNNSDYGSEALSSDPLNRFEDAWKQVLACIIGKVFGSTDTWRNMGRSGIFFDRIPDRVSCTALTGEVAQKIYRVNDGWHNAERARLIVDRAASGGRVLWRSAVYPDAWIDSSVRRISTPPAVWGFNMSTVDFVDLAFDWALSSVPLNGTPSGRPSQ